MKCNPERLIEALITAQLKEQHAIDSHPKQAWDKRETPVVTISRNFGSLGKKAGQLLADSLDVRCCDRYILQEVARRADVDEGLVKVLDEHISHIDEHWWSTLITKNTFTFEEYYKYLVKTIFSISLGGGGVIIGRGANLILGPERAFRVRIVGSPLKCAERVAEREKISLEEAMQKAHDVDQERAEYIRKLYESDIDDPLSYDLVLNSDRYDRVQLVELILVAMHKAGYKLKNDVFDSLQKLA
jgi:hypothetical protein